ncbi:MAG: hypothetical protein ACXWKC_01130 [Xanthobacteraceae bacterium]
MSTVVNSDLTGYSSGNLYPQNGGALNVGGVNFNLATIGPNNHTAVAQTNDNVASITIPVNALGIATVYTLINSAFGIIPNHTIGTIDFYRAGSVTPFTYSLVEGVNVRDHFQDGFVNTVSDPTVVPKVFTDGTNEVRLDRQTIILPTAFLTDTLTQIVLTNLDVGFQGAGIPFVAAIDVSTEVAQTPLPGALPLFASGLAGLGLFGLRRKRKAHAA